MREIRSKDNRIVKRCEQLSMRKYRDQFGLYLIEGENLLAEAVKNHARIETVLLREGCQKSLPPQVADRTFLLDAGSNFIVLDRLQDPGNIGTILRTADAAGYKLAILMKGTADVYAPKVVRAATGSLFRMPVVSMASAKELAEFTGAAGKKLTATCLDARRWYYDEDLTHDIALIIGNEGNGISRDLIESSDIQIKIPMQGNIESLNAAVAAGVLMYEAMRGKR